MGSLFNLWVYSYQKEIKILFITAGILIVAILVLTIICFICGVLLYLTYNLTGGISWKQL